MIEKWKRIPESTRPYYVSNLGRVKRPDGKLQLLQSNKKGYLRARYYVGGKRISKVVQRLVAEVFIKTGGKPAKK